MPKNISFDKAIAEEKAIGKALRETMALSEQKVHILAAEFAKEYEKEWHGNYWRVKHKPSGVVTGIIAPGNEGAIASPANDYITHHSYKKARAKIKNPNLFAALNKGKGPSSLKIAEPPKPIDDYVWAKDSMGKTVKLYPPKEPTKPSSGVSPLSIGKYPTKMYEQDQVSVKNLPFKEKTGQLPVAPFKKGAKGMKKFLKKVGKGGKGGIIPALLLMILSGLLDEE